MSSLYRFQLAVLLFSFWQQLRLVVGTGGIVNVYEDRDMVTVMRNSIKYQLHWGDGSRTSEVNCTCISITHITCVCSPLFKTDKSLSSKTVSIVLQYDYFIFCVIIGMVQSRSVLAKNALKP